MKIFSPLRVEFAESPRRAIDALRPTAEENDAWELEKRHEAQMVFLKFSAAPALVVLVVALLRHGRWHHWLGWLFSIGAAAAIAGIAWLSQWTLAEEPKRRLKALRASRLRAALMADDDAEDPPKPRGDG